MSREATRQKIIKIIAEHQFGDSGEKLRIANVAEKAGISRQAFNRTYDDLTPYVKGEKPISELMDGVENQSSHRFLTQGQSQIQDLRKQLAELEQKHKKAMDHAIKSHITSLMNNDLTLLDAGEVRSTLQKQSLHTQALVHQVNSLELQLTREKAKALNPNVQGQDGIPQNKLILKYGFDTIFSKIKSDDDKSSDLVEDAKEEATSRLLKKLNSLTKEKRPRLIIFAERYASQFETFAKNYYCENEHQHIIVQAPIFSNTDMNIFLRKLEIDYVVSIYIPYCPTPAVLKAQQNFYFRDIPAFELACAEKATTISMSDKLEKLVNFKVKQGD